MSYSSDHHRPKAGVTGKCGVPMWSGGCPAGFCDKEAYSQFSLRVDPKHTPYSAGLRCSAHGGADALGIRINREGVGIDGRSMFHAFRPDFVNLQESVSGFGQSIHLAACDLAKNDAEASQ